MACADGRQSTTITQIFNFPYVCTWRLTLSIPSDCMIGINEDGHTDVSQRAMLRWNYFWQSAYTNTSGARFREETTPNHLSSDHLCPHNPCADFTNSHTHLGSATGGISAILGLRMLSGTFSYCHPYHNQVGSLRHVHGHCGGNDSSDNYNVSYILPLPFPQH